MAYSQNDKLWSGYRLGNSTDPTDTLGTAGCFVTAFANVLAWAGKPMTPLQVNEAMKANGWFTEALVNNHQVPNLLFPEGLEWVGETHWDTPNPVAVPMDFFADASDPNIAYIVYIDASPAPGVQSHFTMVWATHGTDDLIIDDSWDGVRKNLSAYGDPAMIIQAAYKYRKKAVTVNQPLGDDAMWEQKYNDLKVYSDKATQIADDRVKIITDLQQQIGGLQTQLEAAKAFNALPPSNNPPAILNKDTPSGRSFRTLYQTAIVAIPVILGALTLPDVQSFFSNPITTSSVLAVGAAIFSYIQNKTKNTP